MAKLSATSIKVYLGIPNIPGTVFKERHRRQLVWSSECGQLLNIQNVLAQEHGRVTRSASLEPRPSLNMSFLANLNCYGVHKFCGNVT